MLELNTGFTHVKQLLFTVVAWAGFGFIILLLHLRFQTCKSILQKEGFFLEVLTLSGPVPDSVSTFQEEKGTGDMGEVR